MANSNLCLRDRWWLANAVAFSGAFAVYTLIAHGVTGAHDDDVTPAQLLAHIVAHVVVASTILGAQAIAIHGAIRPYWKRIAVGVVAYVFVWEVGWRVIGPPADYGLGFIVLGSVMWLGTSLAPSAIRSVLATGSFLLGIPLGYLVLDLLYRAQIFTLDFSSIFQHWMFFQTIGVATGVLSGFVSSRILWRRPTA